MIIPFIPPEGISVLYPFLYGAFWGTYIRLGVFAIIFILLLVLFFRRIRMPNGSLLFISFFVFLALITVINRKPITPWFQYYFNSICVILIYSIFKSHKAEIISALSWYYSLLCFINCFYMIIYPEGMYYNELAGYSANWILGYKSSFQYYFIPAVLFSFINSVYSRKWLHFCIVDSVCLFESIISKNIMLCIILIIFNIIVLFKLYNLRYFNIQSYSIISISVSIMLVFFVSSIFSTSIGSFFQNVLNKSSTLSSRSSIIWPKAFELIANNPIWGYGVLGSSEYRNIFAINSASHSHNQIINFIIEGGVLSLAFFIGIMIKLVNCSKRHTNKASKCLELGVFMILLCFSIEVITRHIAGGLWLVFIMCFDAESIDEQFGRMYQISSKDIL